MAKFRSYLKLRGVCMTYTTWDWDTTYHSILYRGDVTLHSDTPTTSPISLGTLTGTSDASVLAPNCPYYLLYPLVPEERYVLDGVVAGNIVLKSDATTTASVWHNAYLDKIQLTIQRVTEDGAYDDLGSYSLGSVVESGGGTGRIVNLTREASEAEAEWQYAFPFWIELSAQEVNADERLRLKIEVWGRNWHNLGYRPNTLYLIAAANSDDLYVDLPLV